jgi:hypothetical protein
MRFKLHVVITDPNQFLRGDYGCLTFLDYETSVPGWIDLGQLEFEMPVNTAVLIEKTLAAIDEQIKEENANYTMRMDVLETRKKELIALPAPAENESEDLIRTPPDSEES